MFFHRIIYSCSTPPDMTEVLGSALLWLGPTGRLDLAVAVDGADLAPSKPGSDLRAVLATLDLPVASNVPWQPNRESDSATWHTSLPFPWYPRPDDSHRLSAGLETAAIVQAIALAKAASPQHLFAIAWRPDDIGSGLSGAFLNPWRDRQPDATCLTARSSESAALTSLTVQYTRLIKRWDIIYTAASASMSGAIDMVSRGVDCTTAYSHCSVRRRSFASSAADVVESQLDSRLQRRAEFYAILDSVFVEDGPLAVSANDRLPVLVAVLPALAGIERLTAVVLPKKMNQNTAFVKVVLQGRLTCGAHLRFDVELVRKVNHVTDTPFLWKPLVRVWFSSVTFCARWESEARHVRSVVSGAQLGVDISLGVREALKRLQGWSVSDVTPDEHQSPWETPMGVYSVDT